MLGKRVLSGIAMFLVVLALFLFGGWPVAIVFTIVGIIGQFEFYRAVGLLKDGKKLTLLTLAGYFGAVLVSLLEIVGNDDITYMIFAVVIDIILILFVFVFTFPKYEAGEIVYTFYGFVYVPLLLSFIYLTRQLKDGAYLVWLILIAASVSDMFAYFVGRAIGKHKLAPRLSPKKSIEGAIGGIFFAALAGGIYGYVIQDKIVTDIPVVLAFTVICAIGSVVSQIGDLAASAFKRKFDVKDYGHIIPGHGGALDRCDSILFAAPMVYIVIYVFTHF